MLKQAEFRHAEDPLGANTAKW